MATITAFFLARQQNWLINLIVLEFLLNVSKTWGADHISLSAAAWIPDFSRFSQSLQILKLGRHS